MNQKQAKSNPPIRVWCIAARHAPIIAVFARLYSVSGKRHQTCMLKWDWQNSQLHEGAWTSMILAAHRCFLSPDGEFLLYHAKGPRTSPFPGFYGGAYAVSRLPWICALTDTNSFGPAGGWPSRDALPKAQKEILWNKFNWPLHPDGSAWHVPLGHHWRNLSDREQAILHSRVRRSHRTATCDLDNAPLRVFAVVKTGRWSVWNGQLTYFIAHVDRVHDSLLELPNVSWVAPAPDGKLLVATTEAKLRVYRLNDARFSLDDGVIEQQHDLSTLSPRRGPAPAWAKLGLWQ